MSSAKAEAEILRHEAKTKLRWLLRIGEGESDGTIERVVDCIIGAAILETAVLMQEALVQKKGDENIPG